MYIAIAINGTKYIIYMLFRNMNEINTLFVHICPQNAGYDQSKSCIYQNLLNQSPLKSTRKRNLIFYFLCYNL